MTGSVVWRCRCNAKNFLHWETCHNCGGRQPPPPDPAKPKNDLKSIEQHANKSKV